MKDDQAGEDLARTMVKIGRSVGRQTMALVSDMSQPLGRAIGNALEVKEAIDVLKGKGPEDLRELVLALGSQMLVLAKQAKDLNQGKQKLLQAIQSGQALAKFKELLEIQGGNSQVVEDSDLLPQAKYQIDLPALESGYISSMVADKIGQASMVLGAGRKKLDDQINPAVGLILHKKIGDPVEKGEPLLTIHSDQVRVEEVKALLYDSIRISSQAQKPQLIHQIIGS